MDHVFTFPNADEIQESHILKVVNRNGNECPICCNIQKQMLSCSNCSFTLCTKCLVTNISKCPVCSYEFELNLDGLLHKLKKDNHELYNQLKEINKFDTETKKLYMSKIAPLLFK